ncbi:SDR family oxidoreductase [Alphaproteobacteria bacterium]|nr:SDR family oxidoreductase [Alphaproteobacteria bacterium]
MKVLLFGATGMAGSSIKCELLKRNVDVVGASRSGSDLTCDIGDENQIARVMCGDSYEAVINAAAQVDINGCEQDPLESWKVNAKAVSVITNLCNELDVPFLHISTDHFYTYGDNYAHKEVDPIFCVNEYARHKLAAESFALNYSGSLVLRTSILGRNTKSRRSLVDWAIDSLLNKQEIELFCDAWTSSLDVDTFSKYAIELFLHQNQRGLMNLASSEVYSKEQLIRKLADMLHIDHSKCLSGSIKRLSNRPNCLGLDTSLAQKILGKRLPDMDEVCANLANRYDFDAVTRH